MAKAPAAPRPPKGSLFREDRERPHRQRLPAVSCNGSKSIPRLVDGQCPRLEHREPQPARLLDRRRSQARLHRHARSTISPSNAKPSLRPPSNPSKRQTRCASRFSATGRAGCWSIGLCSAETDRLSGNREAEPSPDPRTSNKCTRCASHTDTTTASSVGFSESPRFEGLRRKRPLVSSVV